MSLVRGQCSRVDVRVVIAALLVCVAVAGCGTDTDKQQSDGRTDPHQAASNPEPGTPATYTHGPGGYVIGDEDTDDIYHSHPDADDLGARDYGHASSAQDLRAVNALVARFYRAAAAGDAARACTLIYRPIALGKDFANVVPHTYASVATSALFEGRTCIAVETVMFELGRSSLRLGAGSVRVTTLRVRGEHGIALLEFKTTPEREIAVEREHGRWTIDALLDNELV